jgi:hypothetical protein
MVPTTRERTDELRELEELWAAPALGEKPVRRAWVPRVPGYLLAGAWLTFYFAVLPFEPEPAPGMSNPAWGTALIVTMIVTLGFAAGIGAQFAKAGFALAAAGGVLLSVIAVACTVTDHHMGSWWLAELAAAVVLTGLAAVGLAQRLRR